MAHKTLARIVCGLVGSGVIASGMIAPASAAPTTDPDPIITKTYTFYAPSHKNDKAGDETNGGLAGGWSQFLDKSKINGPCTSQTDVFTGRQSEIDKIVADGKLDYKEDWGVVKKWVVKTGLDCTNPPPVPPVNPPAPPLPPATPLPPQPPAPAPSPVIPTPPRPSDLLTSSVSVALDCKSGMVTETTSRRVVGWAWDNLAHKWVNTTPVDSSEVTKRRMTRSELAQCKVPPAKKPVKMVNRTFQVDVWYLNKSPKLRRLVLAALRDGKLTRKEAGTKDLWPAVPLKQVEFVSVRVPANAKPAQVLAAVNRATKKGDVNRVGNLDVSKSAVRIAFQLGNGATAKTPWGKRGTVAQTLQFWAPVSK